MTLLPRFRPEADNPQTQIDRITETATDRTERTWIESPSWLRGIPVIGPGVAGTMAGTDPYELIELGYFD